MKSESEAWGVLCALPEELGALPEAKSGSRRVFELELMELEVAGQRVLACVGGVGKVRAARATAALIHEGATSGLLVVGVCGGLKRDQPPGTLVHCERAVQADLAVRQDREVAPDPGLLDHWTRVAPGSTGWFLTADRPALSAWRRLRLARAYAGSCVADMETASAAAVASRAGVPWAALRAVSDGLELGPGSFALPGRGGVRAFRKHFPAQAGRAAETIPALLTAVAATGARTG